MNPQAGPSSQKPTVPKPDGPGVPPCVPNPLPLKVQVVLFFLNYTTDTYQLRVLVFLKTGRENPGTEGYFDCDGAEQYRIMNDAKSEFKKNKWEWNPENIGRYIASGMTHGSELNLATGVAEEASALASFGKPLEPRVVENLAKEAIYKIMEKRVMDNRVAFPEETAIRDQRRKIRLSQNAPPPLTADQLADHFRAACSSALGLIEKKN